MTLNEFRATRVSLPLAQAIADHPHIADLDLDESYTSAFFYADGAFILQKRGGLHLLVEGDEYESRDLALLEFVLWQWMTESTDAVSLREMIWG